MPLRRITPELVEANYASGAWQPRPLYSVVDDTARVRGDAPAVADQTERLTYAELVRRSHSLATWLLQQGLESGATVALQTPNSISLAIMHLACDRADLVFLPLSSSWRGQEIEHLLRVSGAKVVVVPPPTDDFDYFETVAAMRDRLPELELVGTRGYRLPEADFDFDDVSTRQTAEVSRPRDPQAGRYIMVTSGTTDLPKMSLWTDNNLWFFMQCFIDAVEMTQDDVAVGLCPANTGATGYVFPVLAPMLCGASSVLLEHWSPSAGLDLLESERATVASAVPTQIIKMLQVSDIGDRDFSHLRVFQNSGAAMPRDAAERLEDVFGCFCHVVYGATDGGTPTMTTTRDPVEKRWTTVGRPVVHSEVRLVDALLNEVARGQSGEILWRSPSKDLGYVNEPEMTDAAFVEDGWYRSGDLGQLDDEGYLHIVGRAKDLIIRGGQNISPAEIESLLFKHPKIDEVSVIGVPDPVYGERTCACVVPRPGVDVTLSDLTEFLEGLGVATFKLPERIELFEDLPRSAGGKITKVELRDSVAAREGDVTATAG
ncbi:MAG: class I adenylate-forming enzyme family protein [Nocardioides sp.]|uniref:class I adenylate-forming enzyme family protein n=1 Tax=Nocardioides sp. TaxID=35761 RepID=UPI0032652378